MADNIHTRLGMLSSGNTSGDASPGFAPLIPDGVHIDFIGLGQGSEFSLYKRHEGTRDAIVAKISDIVGQHDWRGVGVSGAPREVLNPDILQRLRDAVPLPIITAMGASVAALKACGVKRVLSISPFDGPLIDGIRKYIQDRGVDAVSAAQTVPVYAEAASLTPDQVFDIAKRAFDDAGAVDGIYFQGLVLNPLPIMDRLESELNTTVVASTTSMMWYVLSKLGQSYSVPGGGTLLRDWPAVE